VKRLIFSLSILCLSTTSVAQQYQLETMADDLASPWCLAFLPDGEFLVTELAGRLKRLSIAGEVEAVIKGVPDVYYAGQGGLFDVLLHPGFQDNGLVYLSYAAGTPKKNATTIARARLVNDTLQDLDVIYRVAPTKGTPVHYGGRMIFLPDGTLLLTTGDGFDYREAAQDIESHLGKIIRITDDGTPAKGNPFPKSPYVWSYGHRNAQGLALSRSGTVYQHDHGPRGGDEVNIIRRGINYGWPAITYGVDYNGALISPFTEWKGMAQPEHYWTPSIAPSGLAIYEGAEFPQWTGDLFVGALLDREVRRLELKDGRVVAEEALFGELDARIRDVRTGPHDQLYILTDGTPGKLIRVRSSR